MILQELVGQVDNHKRFREYSYPLVYFAGFAARLFGTRRNERFSHAGLGLPIDWLPIIVVFEIQALVATQANAYSEFLRSKF